MSIELRRLPTVDLADLADLFNRPEVCRLVVADEFERMGLPSVIALLPPTRTRLRAIERFGFRPDLEMEAGGERFLRYRLTREEWLRAYPGATAASR